MCADDGPLAVVSLPFNYRLDDKVIGSSVAWPVDDRTYSYCWSPMTDNRTYYFVFGYGSAGNNVHVDGSGTARG